MCTGINSRRFAALAFLAALILAPGSGRAQVFKLSKLRLPPDVAAGSWVSYQEEIVSKNQPPRRITQRIAVVSREGTGNEAGAWVELKTMEAGKTRTERGFFMRPDSHRRDLLDSLFADDEPAAPDPQEEKAAAPPPQKLRLARYQKLTPDGKLYEYPMDEEGASLPEEGIPALDMLEFGGRAAIDSLPPDTLRVGNRVVPCRVRRTRQVSAQEWEGEDSTYTNRAAVLHTYWKNPYIPVTGVAREVMEVSTARIPAPGQAPRDSSASAAAPPTPSNDFMYRATLTLTDLGRDAVPEITQAPEPAPRDSASHPRVLDR